MGNKVIEKNNTQKTMLKPTVFDDFLAYCNQKNISILFAYILTLILFGMWAYHDIVTFDAEGFYSRSGGEKWYAQWIAIGRWGLVFLKHLLNVVVINPYFSVSMMLLCFPLAAILWGYALYRWSGQAKSQFIDAVFTAVFLSHPVWALQFSFRNQMEIISFVLVLSGFQMILFGEWMKKRGVVLGILLLFLTTFLFSCYQAFLFLYLEGVAIWFFFDMQKGYKENKKSYWINFVRAIILTITAYALYSIITKVVIHTISPEEAKAGSYLKGMILWNEGVREGLQRLFHYLKIAFWGDGVVYTVLYGVAAMVFLFYIISIVLSGKIFFPAVLVYFGIVGLPFLLEIFSAGILASRAQFSFVLALAFMTTIGLEWVLNTALKKLPRLIYQIMIIVVISVIVFPQINLQSRLLYTDVKVMEEDREKMGQIYYQALQQGAAQGDALVFIGGFSNYYSDTEKELEIIGYSYFEYTAQFNSQKAVEAMQAYGYNVTSPTEEQVDQAKEEAGSMGTWPGKDGIRILPGVIIVRLS